jgi:hypothetical protein
MSIQHPTLVAIPISRTQRKIILPALGWIMKHQGRSWPSALDACCADALDYILDPGWPLIVVPTEGPTRPFRYARHPHPANPTSAAIEVATEDIDNGDLGAGLTHVAATFVLTRPEIASSPSRKMRALRARLIRAQIEANATQGGES